MVRRDILDWGTDVVDLYGAVTRKKAGDDGGLGRGPVPEPLADDDLRRDGRDGERAADILGVILSLHQVRVAERRTRRDGVVVEIRRSPSEGFRQRGRNDTHEREWPPQSPRLPLFEAGAPVAS